MGKLVKLKDYELIPGTSGTADIPGVPNTPGTPAHYSTTETEVTNCVQTICTSLPTSNPSGTSLVGTSLGISGYDAIQQTCPKSMVCTTETVTITTYHPAIPGTPGTIGVPGTSGTSDTVLEHLNRGWDSHSQSIDPLNVGEYISFNVTPDVMGVLVSLGINGKNYDKINTFTHSIFIERGGIMVFEDGVKIKTVSISPEVDAIRMYRQPDNSVVCVVISGSDTLIYEFTNIAHTLSSVPLSIYAHLYIAEDSIATAKIRIGQVHFGEA